MQVPLQRPYRGGQVRVSEMFSVEGDVGVITAYAGDMREPEFCGEDDLWAEKDGVDEVQDVGGEGEDLGERRGGEEVAF